MLWLQRMLRLKRLLLVGLTCVPRLELDGPALRHFDSQLDSLRIDQRLPGLYADCQSGQYQGGETQECNDANYIGNSG